MSQDLRQIITIREQEYHQIHRLQEPEILTRRRLHSQDTRLILQIFPLGLRLILYEPAKIAGQRAVEVVTKVMPIIPRLLPMGAQDW